MFIEQKELTIIIILIMKIRKKKKKKLLKKIKKRKFLEDITEDIEKIKVPPMLENIILI